MTGSWPSILWGLELEGYDKSPKRLNSPKTLNLNPKHPKPWPGLREEPPVAATSALHKVGFIGMLYSIDSTCSRTDLLFYKFPYYDFYI